MLLIALALVILGIAVTAHRSAAKQHSWTQVVGVIESSRVGLRENFHAEVEYSYVVGGRAFRGTRIRSHQITVNWPGPARRIQERYPPGSTVTVYVDPASRYNAVLEPGGDPAFLPFIGLMAAIPAVFGFVLIFG